MSILKYNYFNWN